MTLPSASREVTIIGAGPAGATLAYELLQGGLKPLILDKTVFPRIKVCAGGLTITARLKQLLTLVGYYEAKFDTSLTDLKTTLDVVADAALYAVQQIAIAKQKGN